MSANQIFEGIIALAVIWDERAGPSIVSIFPEDSLGDPVGVALQIYLSSVAVFGQHQQAQRVDFSLPLLSISPNHLVRVAFDSWPDPEVRGEVRPFYIGFIMDKETDRVILDELSRNLWNFIDEFKEQKISYKIKSAWEEINTKLQALKLGINKQTIVDLETEEDVDYTLLQAVRDIEVASDLWFRSNDRKALPLALKSAYKLDNVENEPAGHAYFLVGTIFTQTGDLENALEHFSKSAESFKKAEDLQNAAEAMFNSAVIAFRMEKYNLAKSNILLSSDIQQDSNRKSRMFLQLAKIHVKLGEYDSASNSFEIALENALKTNDYRLAAEILSHYSFRLAERAQKTQDQNYQLTLYEHSASQREKASEYLILAQEPIEAASSLVLASKIFFKIQNQTKVVELLLKAKNLFIGNSDFVSACRTLLDIILMLKEDVSAIEQYAQEALGYSEKISEPDAKTIIKSRILNELAGISIINNKGWEAIDFFNQSLSLVENQSPNDFLKIGLKYANFLYKIENFHEAGKIFQDLSKKMGENNPQSPKSLKNAHLSYKRAVNSFLQTANTLLHHKKTDEAIKYYEMVIVNINNVLDTAPVEEINEIRDWKKKIFNSMQQKLLLIEDKTKFGDLRQLIQN
ncbi:MAG: tetratricopeptide repeat protein [Candidatus Hodarchaeales archaeon]|jgi:tetratricopeptide (TPR) repeat protein